MNKSVTDLRVGLTARPFIGVFIMGGVLSIQYNTVSISTVSLLISILMVIADRPFREVLIENKRFLFLFILAAISSTLMPYILFAFLPEIISKGIATGLALTFSAIAGIIIFKFYTKSALEKLGWKIIEA